MGVCGDEFGTHNFRIRILLKTLVAPHIKLDEMLASMRTVYATASIMVEEGTRETLIVPVSPGGSPQLDFNVGRCKRGQLPTNDQKKLFANRNHAGSTDIVIYFVRQTIPPLNGCAVFPPGMPGAIVTQNASRWTLAHEVGHVLGLKHITGEKNPKDKCVTPDFTRLMTGCGTGKITGTPTISAAEITTMQSSPFTKKC